MKPIVLDYRPEHRPAIHGILKSIGWAEQYVQGAVQAVEAMSRDRSSYGSYVALVDTVLAGFACVQYYAWNRLIQIQSLAVHPEARRHGLASALIARAEEFAREKKARGVYVDTPVSNTGGRKFYEALGYQLAYLMPRYYEDGLDGVTYQKFFDPTPGTTAGNS
jgi:ribosomal protein S18 acetylase RimI-like enzyme